MIFLLLSLAFLDISSAQIIQQGQCDPEIQLAENFNLTEFIGKWYVVSRTSTELTNGDCSYFNFTSENDNLYVYKRGIKNNFLEEISGTVTLQSGTPKLSLITPASTQPTDFWILLTDVDYYALAYKCENLGTTQRSVTIWQLGRQTTLEFEMMISLINVTLTNRLGISLSDLTVLDHSEEACTILPTIPEGQPIILPGQCDPNINVVQNFNVTEFTGVWHEISSYYTPNEFGTCRRAQYTLAGNVVNVVNIQVVNQTLDTISGTATVSSNDGSARLTVRLEVQPGVFSESPLWILATDYTNYAISYVCVDLPENQKQVQSWIGSRSRQLSSTAQAAVTQVINSQLDLNAAYFLTTDQSDDGCFYFPEATGQPVTFRGQCDMTIPAMPNFDAARYMGTWYDIESYPSEFQGGSCNTAKYTIVDAGVEVYNTQVINQTLDDIYGIAVPVAADGSAKLVVTFPIAGTNLTIDTDYWVLTTDYITYSLVYTCLNLNADERRVWSWKLSRTRELPTTAVNMINQVISTIPVLDQRYFETKDHSEEGCFYFPEPQPGVPVVFPGQCEDVPVVQSFNMSQGVWYEVAAYPKNEQTGQCIRHGFTQSGNVLNLQSSSVADQELLITNGSVAFSSTDGSAKLIISISNNIQIPYWILSTDYENYALAYSCVNIDQNFKGIYSWKLSRTQQLSAADNVVIDNVISNITVLGNQYYEDIDHSDRACFALPDIPVGEPFIVDGQCDQTIQAVQNFDAARYLGRWRLIESYASDFQNGTCNEATYSLAADGVLVENTQVVDQSLDVIFGNAVVSSTDNSGRLNVTFPDAPEPIEYIILDTDYESYSLVYSCSNINSQQRRVWSWKMSRTRELNTTAIANMNRVIDNIDVLNNRYYEAIDQSDDGCFYYPTAEPNQPVIFRGQCDPNIPVVTNFNAVAYMGRWLDLASYPTQFQEGTCNTANYTLVGDIVDVFNTQVINQTLDTINGEARLATTDGSAKLIVSFPVAGTDLITNTDYWVLATDYETYAFVYTCLNLDAERRQVWSWKLSRTTQLTAAATVAINQVINTVPVLDDRYYNQRDHSDEGCFYFPEPQPGVPVVFPGQCDTTIAAIPNFNMANFTGVWYEIEAYPKDFQPGQCVNHEYSGSGSTLDLVSTNVENQTLSTTLGTLRFASTQDTSGKLEIVIVSGNTQTIIPFWIINTDYNRYALAYSCVNIDTTSRAVYGWKLSRTKELAIIDNAFIETAMAAIPVLENKYFEPIDQSDNACFYLPEHVPGQTVVFPGQCDQNITVVQNFEPARYLNRWRLIESYPTEFQNGTCNDATYTLNANGSIDVYNTQVINQQLDTILGTAVLASDANIGKLLVYFPTTSVPADYWILDTDYDSFSLVYSCVNINSEQQRVTSWKLSRTGQLSAAASERIDRAMERVPVLNSRYFERVDQSDAACFYFPEADGQPVVFRGQCDPNIPVVTNFNAVAYMGRWYDIASYPSVFQEGSCNTANYTLVGDTVDVFNTQVINQTLDTINGVARLATTDGSAKLIVSFPVAGTDLITNTDYWVLATDYETYALVYTCFNLDAERRQVWSWKLSRTTQLTANAVTQINQVISTVPVLDDQYYNLKDHSDEGCFYFPEPQPGVPVVFPGQCDTTIAIAVSNFNMTSFAGVWNEIEAYPKDFQPGQCVNHEYSGSGSTLDLVSTNVENQTLSTTLGTLRFASTQDTSGKLEIVIVSGNTQTVIPFWILDIDYARYALAYSCVNLDDRTRAVYSWKLSRTKELSASDSTAINNTMAAIPVLENKYFEPIDQSDNACFYLPEHVPGQTVVFPGQCDQNITVVQNFEPARYLNRWRLIESYPTEFQNGTCNDATYTLNANGSIDVYNTQVINQQLDTILGTAVLASDANIGKLLVYFPTTSVPADYWILDTDYDSFSLVYSCVNINSEQQRVTSWKLSRTGQLSAAASERIDRAMERVPVLNSRYFERVDQSDAACFYFPEADGQPVVFRGQCDPNIPVVTNFNAVAYMGRWYDIASYPSVFQEGSCNTANYTLVGDTVDVFNTQVINQTLDTINGVARLASTDGSAKLIVSFPVAGTDLITNTDYWVLATDYETYALVYTCLNLDAERRQVWSWKLSRTTQLTANAVTQINQVISTVPVLDDQYYNLKDHSDEGCFYFPEPQPGVPVVFPGQCDTTIAAVSNFNMTSFAGVWNEIEAYPKDFQPGQCVNHEYSGSGSTLDLVSTNVENQTLSTTLGTLRFASTQDTSGKLEIVIVSGNTQTVIPFWILDIDYARYALAYSCVNLDDRTRAVYSWKLSRTKELSASDSTAINNTMAAIPVLENKYFEPIDQSDNACFYLPEHVPGQTVVFPGQCDQNITVVQNFDPTRYTGRWRMIESYPSEFQSGACNDANYTLTPQGTVDVFNTQVIDQALDTINGVAVLASTDGSAKLLVTFPDAPEPSEYWVLATDYDSFALVYSCRNINNAERSVWSWKLSRTAELTSAAENTINQVVDSINVLDARYYETIDQSDDACFYYPTPDGNPVVFRGQCNESIPVVTNFNATRYMGTWYDLESYPVAFQDGTCPSATYTLTSDGVLVYNTQVVNQELDTINGQAVLASDDGSAKLTVSFPIAGTNLTTYSPYWVLATDYDNYALVYSCTNIDTEHRRVASWKLSRRWELTAASETVINTTMAQVPVLRQDYFLTRGHDDTQCFYYPDNEGGPVLLDGRCNISDINIVSDFNINSFEGVWYETERFPSELQTGDCVANNYERTGNNSFQLTKTMVYNERTMVVSGPATLSADGRGIIDVNLSNEDGATFATTLYVIDVDYNDFALLYGCREVDSETKQIYSWKLSRSQQGLSAAAGNRIDSIVNATDDLFWRYYDVTDQALTGCFNYPEFNDNDPITLIGPCDESIRAKSNFDVNAYLGRWFEIASYPQGFQEGECARALYEAGDGVVNVLNTQVVNRTLDVMTATAVVASTDGSGLLSVTFVLANGVVNTVNYYVLETDYTSFALVYSCRNIDSETRQVTSWKLSRERTLSSAAEAIMAPIINNTQGLREDYYQPTSQTEEACFYIPEVNKNEAPRFRGQCETITGVAGFDAQRYIGWWHEIERYPVDENVGDCTSADFRASGNTYQVVDTNIFNLTAEINTSTVTVTADGRLRKTHSDGRVEDIWVLATDYNNYSLLYSCENIDSEYMRIWSAKHSQARSLTQAAQEAMEPVISANRVLQLQFYQEVDQSDSACFHYPEQSGQQIILPGQCDDNIPVQQDFDPANYSGTWYQIERYPQIHEEAEATCIGARYTLNEDTGVVTLVNWQVIDGTLDYTEGTATINSTDGSAKLIVTLPIRFTDEEDPGTVSMWLYVLETNYVSYSVAYSCVNVDSFTRAVGVWKLSRTRSMLPADEAAINALMSRREELHQPYFITVEQNAECDEPSSATTVYTSIIVLLVCMFVHGFKLQY